jgi:preprotein translocase subunit SecY
MKWPLNFFYASNIPVILTAALLANVQLFAKLAETKFGTTFLGSFSPEGTPISGLASWLNSPPLLDSIIRGSFQTSYIWQALIYILFMIGGSIMFAVFWVKTAGMSAENQAKQIISSGLQIPGFRQDPRILESILNRYIMPLTIMGGAAVGFLAAAADLMGALVRGTGLLLAVMIIYRFYEDISKQHAYDMHPALRKVMINE